MTEFRTLLALFVLGSLSQVSAQPLRAQDDAAIRRQLAGYAEARTQGSGEKQASFYAEDISTVQSLAGYRQLRVPDIFSNDDPRVVAMWRLMGVQHPFDDAAQFRSPLRRLAEIHPRTSVQ
jgi:hypothetical protein